MTSKNHQLDLPQIPSLPPLEVPEASSFSSTFASQTHRPPASPRHPSLAPLASQETSSRTIPSSDSNGTTTAFDESVVFTAPPNPSSPPVTLRKSISVDSFIKTVQSQPQPQAAPSSHVTRGKTMSTNQACAQEQRSRVAVTVATAESSPGSSRSLFRERDKRSMPPPPVPPRSRGTSTSTNATADERDSGAFLDESDMERSEDISRRAARKGKAALRQVVPLPGELGLPSRLQTMSSSPNIGTKPSPSPIIPARSSSLSHKMAKQKILVSVDTQLPPPPQPPQITIAVIGEAGCGKSTIIRKGLKAYGLSEPMVKTIASEPGSEDDTPFSFSYQLGNISVNSTTPDYRLRVIEVDLSPIDLTNIGAEQWGKPHLSGVVFCYDASREDSFLHIAEGLSEFIYFNIPKIVLACKSDLDKQVNPIKVKEILDQYDVGLVEVSVVTPTGKEKIRNAFEWILKAVASELRAPGAMRSDRDGYRNPASPSVLGSTTAAEISRASSATPTASSVGPSHMAQQQVATPATPETQGQVATPVPSSTFRLSSPSTGTTPRTPTTPTSPTRARSTSDLFSEHEKSRREDREQYATGRNTVGSPNVRSRSSLNALSQLNSSGEGLSGMDESTSMSKETATRTPRAPPWMTLEELLNKLLFVCVSDDDSTFVSHFLLTYRRFASPRSILLAMQKRMRALDQPSGDPMFACYAQLRICYLLDKWISTYPTDFAVPGSAGALGALIKSIMSKTYLLHYGTIFILFLQSIPTLKDQDQLWALKVEEERDDLSVDSDEDGLVPPPSESTGSYEPLTVPSTDTSSTAPQSQRLSTRDRKSSLPLSAKAFVGSVLASTADVDLTVKQQLKRLIQVSEEVLKIPPADIADEITTVEARYFLDIKPRHWLQHVFVQGSRDSDSDTITRYNRFKNHVADWVVSLILCHDRPKSRARQMECFVQVAERLRTKHNYSALRAVVAGINSATFEGDKSLEIFQARSQEHWKHFQSFDHLLQSARSHQKYRMALRNSKGACIPALEIHLSDLIRADEGNTDYHDDDHSKIHWAKFNMMARFVDVIVACQEGCRASPDLQDSMNTRSSPEYLLLDRRKLLMNSEVQQTRIAPPDLEEEEFRFNAPRTHPRDPATMSKEAKVFQKILFW